MEIKVNNISFLAIVFLAFVPYLLDRPSLINFLPYLYLVIFFLVVICIKKPVDNILVFFTPSAVMCLYVSLFFFMGSLAFKYELVPMLVRDLFLFYIIKDMSYITFYFVCCIGVTIIAHFISFYIWKTKYRPRATSHKHGAIKTDISIILVVSLIMLIIGASFFDIYIPGGGGGSFSSTFAIFGFIWLTYIYKLYNLKVRFLLYVLHGVIIASVFYHDRRLLFFYMFATAFIELYDKRTILIKFRGVVIGFIVMIMLLVLLLGMTIYRGVGQFGSESVLDSILYIGDYFDAPWSKTMFLANLEGPGTFFHSYNAVNHINNSKKYFYGSTIVKFFYLPIPREYYPEKPRSMVDIYTTIYYPTFRAKGGSVVPNFYAEAYWNFGFVGGLCFLLIIFIFLDSLYYKMMVNLRKGNSNLNIGFLASYAYIVFLFRGSGFDLYGVNVIIIWANTFIFNSFKMISNKINYDNRDLA